ncbi:MAG: hypothetical protein ACFFC9_07010 [Promethearchaeota archaeon]
MNLTFSYKRKRLFYLLFILINIFIVPFFLINSNLKLKNNTIIDESTLINTSTSIEDYRITIQSYPARYFYVNMPSYSPAGDLYIAQIAMDDDISITTVPSGWTLIENGYQGGYGEDVRLATYWKIGSSSEPQSYRWGVGYDYYGNYPIWIGVIYRISNFDPDTPIHQSAVTTGVSSNPTAPSITTTIDDCLVFRMFASDDDWTVSSWPSGTTPIFQNNAGYNTLTSAASAYNKTFAGSTGSGIFTIPSSEKWVGITIAIAPPPDITPPTYSDLEESADPLELGETEVITINTTDPSGINQVLIEFEGLNHSMTYISGDMWQYNSWTPTSVGNKSYTIWMEDNNNNWNSTGGTITVRDITAPTYSDLIESADPLQFGDNETITINVYDVSGINQTLIEFEGGNHSMSHVTGNMWEYSLWNPTSVGNKPYIIWMQDYNDNWNFTTGSIDVIDTTGPVFDNLSNIPDPLELGNNITISVDVVDTQDVSAVIIEIELGDINYTMTNYTMNTYEFNWTRESVGLVKYKIYANDTEGNWNSYTSFFYIVDTTKPAFTALNESKDLLELGDNVTISVNATDLSGIKQAKINYEGYNHTMGIIGEDAFKCDPWIPQSTGNYFYTIWIEDNNENWNFTTGDITVQDTISPFFLNLTESGDPIELGENLIITIIVSDLSDIKGVSIEYEGLNHSMANIGGDLWQYDTWTPTSVGNKSYTIWMEDNNNNYNFTTGSIKFEDTTSPEYDNLYASDPLELGNNATININIYDVGGINQTLIEFEGMNHSMNNIYGNVWQYNTWCPNNWTVYQYKIYMEDTSGNSNFVMDNITVQDTTPPAAPIITNAPSGNVNGILTFDWSDGNDPSGISYYILIIDNEANPYTTPGFVYNFNISNIGSESSFYELVEPLSQDKYYYFLFQIDGVGHQSDYSMGTFSIVPIVDPALMNIIILAVILISGFVISLTIVIVRRRMKKEILPAREKVPLKVIISHINKILSSDKVSVKMDAPKSKPKKNAEKSLNEKASIDEEMLKTRIEKIRSFGKELLTEGAYLEAQKQFEFAEKILIRMGRKEEALEFSNLKIGIKELAEEREKKLEQLEIAKLGDNSLSIFELYNDLIELSLRLKDIEVAEMYQFELIEVFQSHEHKLKDLEFQRFKLYKQANSFMAEKTFEKSAELYGKCERISQFLVKLGRENENKNVQKFRDMINNCLKKASQLNDKGSEL